MWGQSPELHWLLLVQSSTVCVSRTELASSTHQEKCSVETSPNAAWLAEPRGRRRLASP
eukprot:CAMPEP_0206530332 /NCGR_PEP_ID=MMETSP0325_2-20121206/3105_1 /ASSEMBLY_ACC=CAM_ASM_000347 /TAXON_ID=2866 /ORGANISM="Crypthecodinium cohnii, Strain Seligo" /LENGTH=58 /DNA_ID=CAMNT_0054026361 /DNA_START=394 /DNA_END=567 /DNA_ORIENTATION=+